MAGGKNVWWGNQGILGVGNRHDNKKRVLSVERGFNILLILIEFG